MQRRPRSSRSDTLAGLMLALENGDPCPLCGAALVNGSKTGSAVSPTGRVSLESEEGAYLECPCCGSQIARSGETAAASADWCPGVAA